ncbi:CopG family transcriptional regulator [Sphingomonas sp. Ant H11]|uniref:CopG family transcriptional regulator n=1 Tax=Sphingomonas sp. Ant H11 TaxID=1564113 RepID=UPI002F41A877
MRIDSALHDRLNRRAAGADLSLSVFIRSVLEQAADPRGRYIYSSQDEILATCIQILTILGTSIGQRTPDVLQKGMAERAAYCGTGVCSTRKPTDERG